MSQLWLFPRTRGLGAVEWNSFRFFPADRFARSNGTNGTEKRNEFRSTKEVTSEALASWCATMSKLGRLRPPKMAACHPSWRTNWRAPRLFLESATSGIRNALACADEPV